MKNMKYSVYCHVYQQTGEVIHANCACKAGKVACCKHVAAVMYNLLDFSNPSLNVVPDDVTCTQVLQK